MTKRFDRNQHSLPIDEKGRKELICWVMRHPCWTVPQPRDRHSESEFMQELLQDVPGDYLPDFGWERCVETMPVFVNPSTNEVDESPESNTLFHVWLEAGQPYDMSKDNNSHTPEEGWEYYNKFAISHDLNLDCGDSSLESVILELALRVKFYYGNYDQSAGGWIDWHKTHKYGLLG